MNKNISWKEKYLLSISEYCSTKDIQKLLGISVVKARELKKQIESEYYKSNTMILCSNKVPTAMLLDLINRDTQYYYKKMIAESKAV